MGRSSKKKQKKKSFDDDQPILEKQKQVLPDKCAHEAGLHFDALTSNDESGLSFFSRLSHVENPSYKRLFLEYLPLGLFCFLIYFLTVCRTVPGGDSGELITVAYRLGVAHPPGYPLYTILAHLMGYIPFGNVATRINFMSALSQIGAGLMMFLLFRRWMRNIWVAWL
ncbi:MAG: DUF2723 domain-containing protein, partial [Bdellovibrionales bacterium]|nr:DUF2723 domain-containing protein [Bdellovibrionales bacterium]